MFVLLVTLHCRQTLMLNPKVTNIKYWKVNDIHIKLNKSFTYLYFLNLNVLFKTFKLKKNVKLFMDALQNTIIICRQDKYNMFGS